MQTQIIGRRIIVLGCCGSGKSTFSHRLQGLTGLPLVHLDMVWWKSDMTHIPREEFDRRLAELTAGERWIIEGDYSRTYEARLRPCDTVVFLDYDEETCMDGLRTRVGQKRSDIPWVEQRLEQELVDAVFRYRQDARPKLLALLEKYPEKRRLIFHTRAEADAWLEDYAKAPQDGCRRLDPARFSAGCRVRFLTEADASAAYRLCRSNPLYYRWYPPLVTEESIREDMRALPPGKAAEDKYYVGYFDGERLIAVLDLIDGYPDPETAWIGLLITDAAVQNAGVGSGIVGELCRYLSEQGFSRVRLCWAEENPQAAHFWHKNGFSETGRSHPRKPCPVVEGERVLP